MDNVNNYDDIINIVKSIMYHLSHSNFNKMARNMTTLTVNSVELLDEITNIIYSQVISRYNFTVMYAHLCACMINNTKFNKLENSDITFQKLLVQKCQKVFMSYKTHHEDLEQLKEEFRTSNILTPRQFKRQLNYFLFDYYNKSLANCRFIGELFKKGTLPVKIILSCIKELLKENDDLQIHCLCIILKLAGPELSKTTDLTNIVNKLLLFKDENIKGTIKSSALQSLILEVQNMHLNGWVDEDPVQLTERNYTTFNDLPVQLKSEYESKSYNIMAVCIFEECYGVLFNFVKNREFSAVERLLITSNTWLYYSPVTFVVSMILVALEENQNIRTDAGALLNNLVMKRYITKNAVQLAIRKVLEDSGIKNEFPDLSHLILDIASQFIF